MYSSVGETGFRHRAIFYDDSDEFATTVVHFVRDGVERGDVVLVNAQGNSVTGLLKAMFAGEEQVVFDGATYDKPVSVVDQYKRLMDRGLAGGARGFRAMGHLTFEGYLPWQEWLRYEAAVNRVFAHYPLQSLCPYSTQDVDPGIVSAMRSAHPTLVEGGREVPSPDYVEPEELVARLGLRTPPDPLQAAEPDLELADVTNLRDVRVDVYSALVASSFHRREVDDFVKAVGEAAINGWTHGVPPVRVRLWVGSDRLVCTVTDRGQGFDDPLRGYARAIGSAAGPSLSPDGGLGLWAARQLVDVLDYERTAEGFSVRLVTYRH